MDAGTLSIKSPQRKAAADRAGFSLVEVCLALGIVAFALLPLVGLLSVGLNSYHNSNLHGPAAQAVSQIATCLRLASSVTDTNGKVVYTASAPILQISSAGGTAPVTWNLDGATTSFVTYFDEDGQTTTPTSTGTGWKRPQLVAMVILTAPNQTAGSFTAGTAQIAVAWPVIKTPTYNASTGISFASPQGHEETTISFVPNSP